MMAPEEHDRQTEPHAQPTDAVLASIEEQLDRRIRAIHALTLATVRRESQSIRAAIPIFANWMTRHSIVRIIAAGRSKLATAIAANRLAHGGAQISLLDGIVPMPHSSKGGGILATSASGETPVVLSVLRDARRKGSALQIVGIADARARTFPAYCDVFIGIVADNNLDNPLQILGDANEHVICSILDAVVAAAGRLAGYDDSTWRLGHEDLGSTGPYGCEPADWEKNR